MAEQVALLHVPLAPKLHFGQFQQPPFDQTARA
jgi:hypothetical protein